MNELALFAGAGGGILGGKLLGWRTICAVERDAYAAQVLAQRQNDGLLEAFPIWSDVCSFDGYRWRGIVDVVSGGFPCQDISAAGKGAGIDGDRSGLWKEMARIICEVRPTYAFIENSPMLTTRGLERVLCDLSEMGFDAEWCVLGADDCNAPHQRKRIWILAANNYDNRHCKQNQSQRARENKTSDFIDGKQESVVYTDNNGCTPTEIRSGTFKRGNSSETRAIKTSKLKGSGFKSKKMAYSKVQRRVETRKLQFGRSKKRVSCRSKKNSYTDCSSKQRIKQILIDPKERKIESERQDRSFRYEFGRWPTEPNMGRVANGVAFRVDRIKALGNGQVPRVAATAFELLRSRIEDK